MEREENMLTHVVGWLAAYFIFLSSHFFIIQQLTGLPVLTCTTVVCRSEDTSSHITDVV